MPGAQPQLRWQASAHARASFQEGLDRATTGGFVIQVGSFRSQDNAERARFLLGGIAPVDVAPTQVGGETLFRVRVGPFGDESAATAALARVTKAGYRGAKITALAG